VVAAPAFDVGSSPDGTRSEPLKRSGEVVALRVSHGGALRDAENLCSLGQSGELRHRRDATSGT
jgi:hypothetical protein